MDDAKPRLSELKAVALVHEAILLKARDRWPDAYRELRQDFGPQFVVKDENYAAYDLALAGAALDMETFGDLFDEAQAKRLEAWCYSVMSNTRMGSYSVPELKAYRAVYQEGLQSEDGPVDAVCAVASRLLEEWLGEEVDQFEIAFPPILGVQADPVFNPHLIAQITGYACGLTGEWRALSQQYRLEAEDLPLDLNWEAAGFFEPGRGPPLTANKKSMWSRMGLAATPEGPFRVLAKGPWDGVRVCWVTLSSRVATQYADDNGDAYGLCVFKNGEPTVHLAARAVWALEQWEGLDWALAPKVKPGIHLAR